MAENRKRKKSPPQPAPISTDRLEPAEAYRVLADRKESYSLKEAARVLHVSAGTVSKYIKYGLLDARQIGKSYLISRDELDDFFAYSRGMTIPSTDLGIVQAATKIRAAKDAAKQELIKAWR